MQKDLCQNVKVIVLFALEAHYTDMFRLYRNEPMNENTQAYLKRLGEIILLLKQ